MRSLWRWYRAQRLSIRWVAAFSVLLLADLTLRSVLHLVGRPFDPADLFRVVFSSGLFGWLVATIGEDDFRSSGDG